MGVEYKVNPYINFDGNIGAGVIGTYGDIGIYHDKFLVNGGASSGIFGLNATMGVKIKF